MFFQRRIEKRVCVREELSAACFTRWRTGCSSAGLNNYTGSLYLKYLLFSRLAAPEVRAVVQTVRNTQLFPWLIGTFSRRGSVQSHAPLSGWFFRRLQEGKGEPVPAFITAQTSVFDWQAGLLSGQTEPISLISPMVFPGFVSTRLGFVREDLSFCFLFQDSLELVSLFHWFKFNGVIFPPPHLQFVFKEAIVRFGYHISYGSLFGCIYF